jgi:hypothetical protein
VSLRERLLALLRVPGRPGLTTDDPEAIRVFKAAPAYLRYRRLTWALKQGGAITGLIFGLIFLRGLPDFAATRGSPIGPLIGMIERGVLLLELAAWAGFAIQAIGSLILLRLDWEQRWYLLSDRSLRIREGLIRMHEKTTTFANIQNISIRQGPLQRLFGIADLEVRSAGGGSQSDTDTGADHLHTTWIRGVADGTAIRDTILDRVRRAAGTGLGDPDDASSVDDAGTDEEALAGAARELLAESRALFATLPRPRVRSEIRDSTSPTG